MHWVIIILLAICLYLLYLYLMFYVAIFLFPIGSIALIGVALFNYVRVVYDELFVGKGWTDTPTGSEPAFKQYFFRKAFHDYWQVVEKSKPTNLRTLEWLKDKGIKLFVNPAAWLTFPLGITYAAVMAVGVVAGCLAYIVFGLIHLFIVLVCAASAMTSAYFLRALEYLLMVFRGISLKCPHGDCHGVISLPHYFCPSCSALHENLLPGDYGVIHRQCKCGAWLPTLFLFGRNQLSSCCPECKKPLNAGIGVTRNIHIPIIGGPSAGKTNFLVASMIEIHDRAKNGFANVAFPEKKYEASYEASSRNFKSGNTAGKTVEESPDAFLFITNTGGSDCLIYMYDAAGELFNLTDKMRRQEYFTYVNGLIFLIDPFSLPQVQANFQKEFSDNTIRSQIRPCEERPQDVYSKLLQTIQGEKGIGQGVVDKPIAVVVTKVDALDIETEIQGLKGLNPVDGDPKQTQDSLAVKRWLTKNGEGNLIRGIERDFKQVSYFCCSPLGRLPDSSNVPFSPKGVLNPLNWLLGRYGVDFENGNASNPIDSDKTSSASGFIPVINPNPGESNYGKLIAIGWAFSVIALFLCLLAFIPLLSVIGQTSSFSPSSSSPQSGNNIVQPKPEIRTTASTLPSTFNRNYSGTIGNGIGFSMSLTKDGGTLKGEGSTGKSWDKLSGSVDANGGFELKGYQYGNKYTGVYRGTIYSDGTVNGSWSKPDGSNFTSFDLSQN